MVSSAVSAGHLPNPILKLPNPILKLPNPILKLPNRILKLPNPILNLKVSGSAAGSGFAAK
jgi:hypothetical protein